MARLVNQNSGKEPIIIFIEIEFSTIVRLVVFKVNVRLINKLQKKYKKALNFENLFYWLQKINDQLR